MCRLLRASSLFCRVSCHVGCGAYLPGRIGTNSFIGRPKTHMAGDSPVSGSGVFLYVRMARRNESVSREPFGPVFDRIIRLTVFTPTSARQLECGKATDDFLC